MYSGDVSISRSFCPHCNIPKSSIGQFTTREGGCVTLVDNVTHTEWPISVDIQLGSPLLVVDSENHNKSSILLCDDEES
ncbi:hypothetical protein H5410_002644 [Solanum commersonii]|uniref:Uncharacterized protein n=1 Tax=Solanum commersonii TaxID=4109 RepID=A0A9J6B3G4_SOLCO|nr:hypothetical protein H5410_002644 [Solanum commersonii]